VEEILEMYPEPMTYSFAELAGDAAFLAGRIPS
jgi:hypothetical protein